jgi:hypothetical protein
MKRVPAPGVRAPQPAWEWLGRMSPLPAPPRRVALTWALPRRWALVWARGPVFPRVQTRPERGWGSARREEAAAAFAASPQRRVRRHAPHRGCSFAGRVRVARGREPSRTRVRRPHAPGRSSCAIRVARPFHRDTGSLCGVRLSLVDVRALLPECHGCVTPYQRHVVIATAVSGSRGNRGIRARRVGCSVG